MCEIPQKQKPSGTEGAGAGVGAGIQAETGAGEIRGRKWDLIDISDSECKEVCEIFEGLQVFYNTSMKVGLIQVKS